ncbi:HNH endonuclease [Salaquimonas pukyongi]|uniref:HNH endonuclease n=1 Tax=Salaquimonas pukyongi TaxID=2712698 RepID=UPI00096B6D10|nr:HNH endonuclease signature motif containing protein [Salaquimonas pukyongi]
MVNWTREEIEEAIRLYLVTPFGKIHSSNPEIIDLSHQIGRTPSAVALKLANLASIDETLNRRGMANASRLDKDVWKSFFDTLAESAAMLPKADTRVSHSRGFGDNKQEVFESDARLGTDTKRVVSVRQGQQFFRDMILASYDFKCAITGIEQQELLVAGHIRPWSVDHRNRMNPRNGICLNRLHDKAFEAHLIAIEDDGKILYSRRLLPEARDKLTNMNKTGYISFPSRFRPDLGLLREHRENFHD